LGRLTTYQLALAHWTRLMSADAEQAAEAAGEARRTARAIHAEAAAWRAFDAESYDTLLAEEAVLMADTADRAIVIQAEAGNG
jgi:hypothetical protein